MDDDRLLRELGQAARRAEARAAEDEERERAIVDPAGEQAAIAAVLAARATRSAAHAPTTGASEARRATLREAPAPRADRVTWSRWSRVAGIGLVAAAAAAALVVTTRGPRGTATLPGYQLEVRGGVSSERGERGAEPIRVAPDTRLSLVARPRQDARAAVGARVVVLRGDRARVLDARPRIGPTGVVTAELGAADVLDAGDASAEVIVLVGAGSALPEDTAALLALARQATPPDDVRVLRVAVTRASPSGP